MARPKKTTTTKTKSKEPYITREQLLERNRHLETKLQNKQRHYEAQKARADEQAENFATAERLNHSLNEEYQQLSEEYDALKDKCISLEIEVKAAHLIKSTSQKLAKRTIAKNQALKGEVQGMSKSIVAIIAGMNYKHDATPTDTDYEASEEPDEEPDPYTNPYTDFFDDDNGIDTT